MSIHMELITPTDMAMGQKARQANARNRRAEPLRSVIDAKSDRIRPSLKQNQREL